MLATLDRLTARAERCPAPGHVPAVLGPCLLWGGCLDGAGYGQITVQGRDERVHRVAWVERHGPIPAGLMVLHRCDVRPCIADWHLWLGTRADNMADMVAKGRAGSGHGAETHCPSGHAYDEANTYRRPSTGYRQCRQCRDAARSGG